MPKEWQDTGGQDRGMSSSSSEDSDSESDEAIAPENADGAAQLTLVDDDQNAALVLQPPVTLEDEGNSWLVYFQLPRYPEIVTYYDTGIILPCWIL